MRKVLFLPIFLFILITAAFFVPFFTEGKLPIPSDTIIGLYHPFRDLYAKEYPNGIPFKNSLITDPVRQQYPWRWVSIGYEQNLQLPLWNSYAMAGIPLLGNGQSAAIYPLNIFLFILPFSMGWSWLVVLQPLLGGIFLFFYLRNLKLDPWAGLLGAFCFGFSGFFVAWMEWGTVLHVALWLPLLLLCIDKLFEYFQNVSNSKFPTSLKLRGASKFQISNKSIKIPKDILWSVIFIFSLCSSFLAGHLQTFFYLYIFIFVYFVARWFQHGKEKKPLFIFILLNSIFLVLTAIQWVPEAQLISLSARAVDQNWQKAGWFIPWEHSIQFIAPDFFGNPATGNYWGVWNYGEFIGYIGILPIIFVFFALFARRDKKTLFFGAALITGILLAFPNFVSQIPFMMNIPFLSTAQPTRLLFIIDFSLAVLAAFGMDYYLKHRSKKIILILVLFAVLFGLLWIFVLFSTKLNIVVNPEYILTAKRNLYIPSLLLILSIAILVTNLFIHNKKISIGIIFFILVITIFDLFRFAQKFTPFTSSAYLFPSTQTTDFLQQNIGAYRFMAVDDQILPPNFQLMYKLSSIEGYDPLYLRNYGELLIASERGKPDISPPFGFNRIITPHNYNSKIIDLLGVKYILSLNEIKSSKLRKVFTDGQTIIYENLQVLPRVFFIKDVLSSDNKQTTMNMLFGSSFNPQITAVIENQRPGRNLAIGTAKIVSYDGNFVSIQAKNKSKGFLVLTDTYYPTWSVIVDGNPSTIYKTDYNFRGVYLPAGEHMIVFKNNLL